MTKKQVYNQITQFTGDWKSAKRKTDVFEKNCCVSLHQVESIELSFGKFGDGHGNYYGENRDTLHFSYVTNQREKYHFSILD